jgi:hypothetical protein
MFNGEMMRALLVVALFLPTLALADGQANPYLGQAKVFYQGLDYEKCLQRLDKASRWKSSTNEQAEIELFTGLCQYALGNKDELKQHLRDAIQLDPKVQVPSLAPPRFTQMFQEQLAEYRVSHPEEAAVATSEATNPAAGTAGGVSKTAEAGMPMAHIMAYTMMGVGVVGIGTGIGFGLWANSTANQLNTPGNLTQQMGTKSDAQSRATISTVSYVVGGALLASGLAVRIFWPEEQGPKSSDTKVGLTLSTNGVIVAGAF